MCMSVPTHHNSPQGSVDLERMESAGQLLMGEHDFRNFCKMDVNNGVVKFVRRIGSVGVDVMKRDKEQWSESEIEESPYDICRVVIRAKAFLWHQIR